MRSVGALVLCSIVMVGCKGRKPAAPDGAPKPEARAEDDGLVAKGRDIVKSKDCVSCHSVDGTEADGPTFKGMYAPEKDVPVKGLPACPCVDEGSLTEAEAAAVIRFVKSLR
ncbi:MAG: c-type cytochrome [Planctomycetota bacterium]